MQPTGRGGPAVRSGVTLLGPNSGSLELCGRQHESLQLICISLGGNTEAWCAATS